MRSTMTTTRPTILTALLAVAALALLGGCSGGSTSPDAAQGTGTYVYDYHKVIYRTVTAPGTLRFKVTGINPETADEYDNRAIVFFYDPATGFDAGVGSTGGFQGEFRTQKLKLYDSTGSLVGDESARWADAYDWNERTVYQVTLRFGADFVSLEVPGLGGVRKDGPLTYPFLLGFGDPSDLPGVFYERNQFPGAVVSHIEWPDSSKNQVSTF